MNYISETIKQSEIDEIIDGACISACASPSSSNNSDEIEQKVWDVIKQIPGLNVGYGSIRLVIYIGKGNKDESWKSAAGVAKGLVQTAAIAGGVFVAPIMTPIAAGALTGVVSESIHGVAHLIVFIIEHPDALLAKESSDQKEKLIYKEIKEIPAIGTAYSAARTPVYLLKGNKNEAKKSGIDSIFGGVTTAATCGISTLTMLDEQTQKIIQKLSKSIIQMVSRKVLQKVAAKEMTLEEGLEVVEKVQEKCETLANPANAESTSTCQNGLEDGLILQINLPEIQIPTDFEDDKKDDKQECLNSLNDSKPIAEPEKEDSKLKPRSVRHTLGKCFLFKCTTCKHSPKIQSSSDLTEKTESHDSSYESKKQPLPNLPTVPLIEDAPDSTPIIIVI